MDKVALSIFATLVLSVPIVFLKDRNYISIASASNESFKNWYYVGDKVPAYQCRSFERLNGCLDLIDCTFTKRVYCVTNINQR